MVTIGEARQRDLLEIDRGWEGTAGGGIVSLQRWRSATPEGQRHHFWDTFQTMIHEYLHTLTHARYDEYALSLPGGDAGLQYNTMIEGMTSAMTEIVWVNVAPKIRVRRRSRAGSRTTSSSTRTRRWPPARRSLARYPSYHQAMQVISIVGPRNVFAAYLLGEVDLVRASRPAR